MQLTKREHEVGKTLLPIIVKGISAKKMKHIFQNTKDTFAHKNKENKSNYPCDY